MRGASAVPVGRPLAVQLVGVVDAANADANALPTVPLN